MIRNIESDFPHPSDRILVDANVLLFLAMPFGNYYPKKIKVYSNFLNTARKSKTKLYFSSLILSEFANVWLRYEFESFRVANPHASKNFKADFRPSQACQDAMQDIHRAIRRQVIPYAQPIDDQFEHLRIDDFFHLGLDVNDAHSIALSKQEGLSILTDDSDFAAAKNDIDIWTWNRKLLNP